MPPTFKFVLGHCAGAHFVQQMASKRMWNLGRTSGANRRKFFWPCPSTFLARRVQLVVLLSAFVMVSTVWTVSCLLFFYSRCPPCQAICKSGGISPLFPMESAPLHAVQYTTDYSLFTVQTDERTHILLITRVWGWSNPNDIEVAYGAFPASRCYRVLRYLGRYHYR